MILKVFYLMVTFYLFSTSECLDTNPVYFLDEGNDQTIGYRTNSQEEKVNIESTLLTMLNLKRRPKFIRNPMKKSTSRFLLDIYKMISKDETDHNVEKRSLEGRFYSELFMDELQNSDTIMAFSVRKVRSLGRLKGKVFWIDTKKLTAADELLKAELRVFKSLGRDEFHLTGGKWGYFFIKRLSKEFVTPRSYI